PNTRGSRRRCSRDQPCAALWNKRVSVKSTNGALRILDPEKQARPRCLSHERLAGRDIWPKVRGGRLAREGCHTFASAPLLLITATHHVALLRVAASTMSRSLTMHWPLSPACSALARQIGERIVLKLSIGRGFRSSGLSVASLGPATSLFLRISSAFRSPA